MDVLRLRLLCALMFALSLSCFRVAAAQDEHQAGQETELPYKYVGNNFSHKFHRPSCTFAQRIWPSRVELFHFRRDAIEAHYAPCHYCLPPVWTRVYGKILGR